jgi:NAD-dependent DNA ligase
MFLLIASSSRWASARSAEATAKLLARHYRSFSAWREAMIAAQDEASEAWQDLIGIDQIGPLMARDLVAFFAENHNLRLAQTRSRP